MTETLKTPEEYGYVMGNEPGVALADYSCDNVHMKVLDKLSEEIYNK